MKNKILLVIICCVILFLATGAKKTVKSTKTKSGREISELKNTIFVLEAQRVSMTAKVDILEKDINKLKNSTKTYMLLSAAGGSAALIMAIILIAGAFGKNKGSDAQAGSSKTLPGREKHYEDIEYHVLNDWQNIWFHPENIDMKLYDDMKNHYPELHAGIGHWKATMLQRQKLAAEMGKELSRTYPAVETLPYVYLLAYEEPDLFIEKDEIKSGPYVCAQVTPGTQGTREMMTEYYDECIKMFAKNPCFEIKSLNGDVIGLKNEIDMQIRKIKFTRNLPGDCDLMQA